MCGWPDERIHAWLSYLNKYHLKMVGFRNSLFKNVDGPQKSKAKVNTFGTDSFWKLNSSSEVDFQDISSWALTAVVSLDSVRDQWAVWAACALPWLRIHSPSQSSRSSSPVCPSCSCNTDSTHPTSALCDLDFQSTCSCSHSWCRLFALPKQSADMYLRENRKSSSLES